MPSPRHGARRWRDGADAGAVSAGHLRPGRYHRRRGGGGSRLHGDHIVPGDVLLGYASTGLHTNGYTLARRIVFERMKLALDDRLGDTGQTVADACSRFIAAISTAITPVYSGCTAWRTSPGAEFPATWCGYCRTTARRWWIPPHGNCRRSSRPAAGRTVSDRRNAGRLQSRHGYHRGSSRRTRSPPRRPPPQPTRSTTWPMGEIRRGDRAVTFAHP